jgi:hypothetical protein
MFSKLPSTETEPFYKQRVSKIVGRSNQLSRTARSVTVAHFSSTQRLLLQAQGPCPDQEVFSPPIPTFGALP